MPSFQATEKNGFLYGRGVSDDKGMASAIVAIVLELARTRATLARDLIVALTAGEESDQVGIRWLVEHRELIDAELALDEGGAIVAADDQSHIAAVEVSATEKITQNYRLVAHGPGGHSSPPSTDADPAAMLGRAVERIAAYKFTPRPLPAVTDQLGFRATREQQPIRGALERLVTSAPEVTPGDEQILSTDRYLNALIHTTCVTTMLQASPQANVLPTTAEAVVNCRILPDETPAHVKAALELAIGDPAVVGPPAGDRHVARPHGAVPRKSAGPGRPLHRVARPGLLVHDRVPRDHTLPRRGTAGTRRALRPARVPRPRARGWSHALAGVAGEDRGMDPRSVAGPVVDARSERW